MKREEWNDRYAAVENLWAAKPNRFLVAEVSELEPGRALDFACGEGQNAIWLASLGWDVTGVDFSEVAIEQARARAERDGVRVGFVCADLLEYQSDPGAFASSCSSTSTSPLRVAGRCCSRRPAQRLPPAARSSWSGTTSRTSRTALEGRAIWLRSIRRTRSRMRFATS